MALIRTSWFLATRGLLVLAIVGCAGTTAEDAVETDAPGGLLSVSPTGPIELGYFEEQVFSVLLTDEDGAPLADEPVQASLIGPAHNGGLSPFELTTDEEGRGEVIFAAPDQEVALQIRFTSPAAAAEPLVDVVIDPDAFGLTVEVEYAGARLLTAVSAELVEGATCAELAAGNGAEPSATQSAGAPPVVFAFSGLHAGSSYAVRATGRNSVGETRATTCTDGLSPNEAPDALLLADIPFDLAGVFDVTTSIAVDDALDPAVDELAAALAPFAEDVPGTILDAIRDQIDEEPVAGETFDQVRADEGLDAVLAQDLVDRSVDVAGLLETLWDLVRDRIDAAVLTGAIELSAPDEGTHELFHSVTAIAFEGVAGSFLVAVPEIGEATATIATDDPDLLLLDGHPIGLGLGGPLEFVVGQQLADALGAATLPGALEDEVDCAAVVVVLATPLAEVADSSSILAGCQQAMASAGTLLDDALALLSANHGQLSFAAGSCRLADPGVGDQVDALVDGEVVIEWTGTSTLGPMTATFSGELAAD